MAVSQRIACDVAIVGAGPVGVTLAALLGQAGVSCFIADRSDTVYPLPRAAHFDHEIMRIFQQLGITDAIAPSITCATRYVFQNAAGEVLIDFDFSSPAPTGWHGFMIHQPGIEHALRARLLDDPGVTLRTGCDFLSQEATDDGVVSHWQTPDGRLEVASQFLVGCDGAWSPVRESLGLPLDDLGFDEPWLVLDLEVDENTNLPRHSIQYCDPARPTTYALMGNSRRRFEFMLLEGETAEEMMRDEAIEALLAPHAIDGLKAIERRAVYRFHALVAERWRAGPVMIAGDAAHQMPPFAGQGMCSGIRDAAALAWRIALVAKGADMRLLESYQAEREPHVRAITAGAIETGRMVCTLDPDLAAQRDAQLLAARAAGLPPPAIQSPNLEIVFGLSETRFAGTVFPQPFARDGDTPIRFDDVMGPGAWLVCRPGAAPRREAAHPDLTIVETDDATVIPFADTLDTWLEAADANAVLVRADRYVFGTGEAERLVDAFETQSGLRRSRTDVRERIATP